MTENVIEIKFHQESESKLLSSGGLNWQSDSYPSEEVHPSWGKPEHLRCRQPRVGTSGHEKGLYGRRAGTRTHHSTERSSPYSRTA